jgi:hypothetical protein
MSDECVVGFATKTSDDTDCDLCIYCQQDECGTVNCSSEVRLGKGKIHMPTFIGIIEVKNV